MKKDCKDSRHFDCLIEVPLVFMGLSLGLMQEALLQGGEGVKGNTG